MNIIVGIADMKISKNPQETLVTYSLGSCIGVLIWDPVVKVGGLLHYMLPEAKLDKARAEKKPYMFGDSGIVALFKEAFNAGAVKSRLVVRAVGGAQINDPTGVFSIGKRNYLLMKKLFEKNNITVKKEDIGGVVTRTVSLDVGTGRVLLTIPGKGEFEL